MAKKRLMWVSPSFHRELKKLAADEGMTIIKFTKERGTSFFENKKRRRAKYEFSL